MSDTLLNSSTRPMPKATGGAPKTVIIVGAPRSGTSWLGKIFDSHPMVIYRHEPDDALGAKEIPLVCPVEQIPRYTDAARRQIMRWKEARLIKCSGTWPLFRKEFHPLSATLTRRALVLAVRATQQVSPTAAWLKRISIPDLIRSDLDKITYVIKSVSRLGDVELLARALPDARIIVLYRHPCGHMASLKRGESHRIMGRDASRPMILATPRARQLGFTKEKYQELSVLDCHAWAWAFLHEKVFTESIDTPNVCFMRYEHLCSEPLTHARRLVEFAELPWREEIADFISASTRTRRTQGYFSLYRDPIEAANKWRQELTLAEIIKYRGIVEQVIPDFDFDFDFH
jgi:hypothetical protein